MPGARAQSAREAGSPKKKVQVRASVAPSKKRKPASQEAGTPWSHIDKAGRSLDVFVFPTTLMTLVGAVLRRSITLPYLESEALTYAEWKMLSTLGHGESLPFLQIEILASTDKSLVSKTLRLLEKRGLVTIKDRGHAGKKQLISTITADGQVLHDRIIAKARSQQAKLLLMLSQEDRDAMYRALQLWHEVFAGAPLPAAERT